MSAAIVSFFLSFFFPFSFLVLYLMIYAELNVHATLAGNKKMINKQKSTA